MVAVFVVHQWPKVKCTSCFGSSEFVWRVEVASGPPGRLLVDRSWFHNPALELILGDDLLGWLRIPILLDKKNVKKEETDHSTDHMILSASWIVDVFAKNQQTPSKKEVPGKPTNTYNSGNSFPLYIQKNTHTHVVDGCLHGVWWNTAMFIFQDGIFEAPGLFRRASGRLCLSLAWSIHSSPPRGKTALLKETPSFRQGFIPVGFPTNSWWGQVKIWPRQNLCSSGAIDLNLELKLNSTNHSSVACLGWARLYNLSMNLEPNPIKYQSITTEVDFCWVTLVLELYVSAGFWRRSLLDR